ncbi:MAG: Gfo/Idh/MocA family protein [Bryobacteraceae bacterium]
MPEQHRPHPILIIGAGGIVHDAHLPAYRKARFPVFGIYDLDKSKAEALARKFAIPTVFQSLEDAVGQAPENVIFDVAIPPSGFLPVLERLPDGAAVLLQKPMGQTIQEAGAIRDFCHAKKLTAAVNFQMRFAPAVARARKMIQEGLLGEVHDMEVRILVYTPWQLWTFLEGIPRMEILHHSVHYIDLVRSFFGDPARVYARTVKHPSMMKLASTRSNIIMDYGDIVRANITTNHGHMYGIEQQESYVKWEGTRGAIKSRLGLLLDYPRGQPDDFRYALLENGKSPQWQVLTIDGTWFPDAFIGSMRSLMAFLDGDTDKLPTSVDDAYKTMAVVEAAYQSNDFGGTKISYA